MVIKKNSMERTFVYLLFIVWIFMILFGIKEYTVWSQILDIGMSDNVLQNLYDDNHPHLLRFALMYPTMLFSEYLNIKLNLVFSIEVVFINIVIFILLNQVMNHIFRTKRYYILLLFSLFIINLFMNGRIIFGFLGSTILIHTFYFNSVEKYSSIKFFLIMPISLFIMSVSTGTFMVGVISICIYISLNLHKNYIITKNFFDFKILFLILGFILILPLLKQYINKNLNYFDGSVFVMLSHGIGRIFYNEYILFLFILSLPILIFTCVITYSKVIRKNYVIALLPILIASTVVGLFGHSSLSVGLPALFTFMSIYINKLRIKNDRIKC